MRSMVNLWLPTGNKKQTEIDIEIAALASYKSKASIDLAITRKDLILVEEDLYELSALLEQLRGEVLIVSINEFKLVKSAHYKLLHLKTKHLSILRNLKQTIKEIQDRQDDLLELREKSATKILEFNYNERIRKRFQNRD